MPAELSSKEAASYFGSIGKRAPFRNCSASSLAINF